MSSGSNIITPRRITTRTIQEMKDRGERIACLTAYDYLLGRILDETGIDMVLVGDSVSNVFQGNATTLPVTLEEMIYHTKAVSNVVRRALVITDLPFMTYQVSTEEAFRNAGRIMKETQSLGVKVEGGQQVAGVIRKISSEGIPIMGHIGLMPQSILKYGGYRPRGTTPEEAEDLLQDALALQDAGAFAIVLEKIPASLAKSITEQLHIPTIGIGAGQHCSGQILVTHDMLGLFEDFRPRFVRRYAALTDNIHTAVQHYIEDVKSGNFPNESESY
jgi:3-methyl-2-oxobutanoate hydroxymethyltransferase